MKNAVIEHDRRIVPLECHWGPGYGKPYTLEELDAIAAALTADKSEGPKIQGVNGWTKQGSRILVQSGFDAASVASGKVFDRAYPTEDGPNPWVVPEGVGAWMEERGWDCDQHGRAWHPHYRQLLGDERVRLHTGIRNKPWLGEQVCVDVVVTDGKSVLVPYRSVSESQKFPTLPGGRVEARDYGLTTEKWMNGARPVTWDGIFAAAHRHIKRETGRKLPLQQPPRIVWAYRPVSGSDTLNTWAVRYVVLAWAELQPLLGMRPHVSVKSMQDLDEKILYQMRVNMRESIQAARRAL